ncbi:MAG: phenylpyruvate tautomerase MIF-related protein [Ruminococcus sp.]|nr:phenylpyruvate tautomerase MIF-related protein [Ruminococcus sp.]
MPFINVKTSAVLDNAKKETVKSRISKAISLIPGKSEAYLMCAVEDNISMMFRGSSAEPTAFVEVKILGSSTKEAYADLTAEICNILSEEAGVQGRNCYVKFEEVKYWGMDGFMF